MSKWDAVGAPEAHSHLYSTCELATPGIAGVSALYVLRQYHRSVAWRKSHLAAGIVSRLERDEELTFTCRLNWGTRLRA
jgi:hypothetical protein